MVDINCESVGRVSIIASVCSTAHSLFALGVGKKHREKNVGLHKANLKSS